MLADLYANIKHHHNSKITSIVYYDYNLHNMSTDQPWVRYAIVLG